MSGITGSMLPEDMKLVAIKVGIGLLVVAVVLFSAWLFFRYKFRKQVKPLDPLKVMDLDPKAPDGDPEPPHRDPEAQDAAPKPQDRGPGKKCMSSMMEGFAVTAEECHDPNAPIGQGPYIFVVPVTQAMLDSGAYTGDGSSGWLMQQAGLVGQPLAASTVSELQSGEVVHRGVLPGGAGQPKVSAVHLPSPSLTPDERTLSCLKRILYRHFRALFDAMAAAQLDPGATLVIPMIHYEGSGMQPEVYRRAFVEAFTEAASAVTRGGRKNLASSLGVERVRVYCSNGPEWECMGGHFQRLISSVDDLLKERPNVKLTSCIQHLSEDVAAVAGAPPAAPAGELDDAGLEGARRFPHLNR